LREWEETVAGALAEAQTLEGQQERRLYVLSGLRQISHELGFAEVGAPQYERQGDKRSAVIYTVDTFDEGEIKFYVGLDGIHSHSVIPENHCLDDFDKFSEALLTQFGIKTQFNVVGKPDLPRLKQKGEKDLPDEGGAKTQEA